MRFGRLYGLLLRHLKKKRLDIIQTHDIRAVSELGVVRQCSLGGTDHIQLSIDGDIRRSRRPERFPGLAHGDGLLELRSLLGLLGRLWDVVKIVQPENGMLNKPMLNKCFRSTRFWGLSFGSPSHGPTFWPLSCLLFPSLDCFAWGRDTYVLPHDQRI
jgi:hypothetical protein